MDVKSNNDRPFDIAVSSFCWSTQSDTPFARQFSKTSDQFDQRLTDPIDGPDQYLSIAPDWIALITAISPGRRS